MKMISITSLALASVILLGFGCATKHKEAAGLVTANEVVAASELNRSVVSKISFIPGQDGLSPEAASELQKAIADARKMGEIKTVEVAVWSDLEYPAKGQSLSKKQIELANQRAKNVEKLIDQVEPSSTVKTFNMAKQPNAFQKWVDTRDAHVKQKLASAGITSPSPDGQASDRASSALIFIEVK